MVSVGWIFFCFSFFNDYLVLTSLNFNVQMKFSPSKAPEKNYLAVLGRPTNGHTKLNNEFTTQYLQHY